MFTVSQKAKKLATAEKKLAKLVEDSTGLVEKAQSARDRANALNALAEKREQRATDAAAEITYAQGQVDLLRAAPSRPDAVETADADAVDLSDDVTSSGAETFAA